MATQKRGAKPAIPKKPSTKPAAKKKVAGVATSATRPPHAIDRSVIDTVLEKLVEGNSLRSICAEEGMPAMATFMRWLAEEGEEGDKLRERYAHAREAQAETIAEDILTIADEECTMVKASKHGSSDDGDGETEVIFDATAVARNRLRVDARKWLLSKLVPKKYGDKVQTELTGAGGGAIEVASTVTFVQPKNREDDQ
jgi:hypothetical protein